MKNLANWICTSLTISLFFLSAAGAETPRSLFNVRDFGAAGTGDKLDTSVFNATIDACAKAGGGTVYVPPGRYLSGTIELKSHILFDLDAGATILGSENPDDYPPMDSVFSEDRPWIKPLIFATDAEDVTITGHGTLDGQGAIWWKRVRLNQPRRYGEPKNDEERAEAAKLSRGRPNLIRFVRCKNVVIEHIYLRNSPVWNIHPVLCDQIRIDGVTINAPATMAHNTDGINPESCRNVQIINCRIDTGDDGITLKSGMNEAGRRVGKPDENITITNCVVYHAHGGVTIGSEMSGGVRNVVVANCVFQGTDTGIRLKSQRGRGGIVEGLAVSNIVMQDVPTPFIITTFYSGGDKPTDIHPVDEGTPIFRDMLFSNITARGARIAGAITGLRELPIEDVTFSNVHIRAQTGFIITNAKGVTFLDSTIDTAKGPALILKNATDVNTARLRTHMAHDGVPMVQTQDVSNQPATQPQ